MQHTTTGGWNEGGVKLGQLGVPTSGERVGSILSLSLVFFYTYVDTHTRTSAQTRELYLHRCSPAFFLFLSSLLLFFLPHRLRAAACGKSRNTRFETECEIWKGRKKKKANSSCATCRWIARVGILLVAELLNCGIRIIIFDRKDARYNNPVSCYLYYYVRGGEIVWGGARFLDSQEHDHFPQKYRSRDHYTP